MGSRILYSIAALQLILACSDNSGFKSKVNQKTLAASNDAVPDSSDGGEPVSEGTMFPDEPTEPIDGLLMPDSGELARVPVAPVTPVIPMPPVEVPKPEPVPEIKPVPITIEVRTSAPDVRAGKKPIQAEAVLSSPSTSKIIWSIEGAMGIDIGAIDSSGKYLSPDKATAEISVTIVATLESDPTVVGKKTIKVIPAEQLFIGCKKGNLTFPISADVFKLPPETPKLPDFTKLTRDDIVCLDKYDIPLQSWEVGFPGSPMLQEWFALHSKAKLVTSVAGEYVFRLISDDGAKLYLNGNLAIDNDGTHSVVSKEGTVTLSAGKQDLVLDYFQGPRTEVALQLEWKIPGSSKFVIVPASAFSAE